jgi:hypothetical protein
MGRIDRTERQRQRKDGDQEHREEVRIPQRPVHPHAPARVADVPHHGKRVQPGPLKEGNDRDDRRRGGQGVRNQWRCGPQRHDDQEPCDCHQLQRLGVGRNEHTPRGRCKEHRHQQQQARAECARQRRQPEATARGANGGGRNQRGCQDDEFGSRKRMAGGGPANQGRDERHGRERHVDQVQRDAPTRGGGRRSAPCVHRCGRTTRW